jgi:hypothetical protein
MRTSRVGRRWTFGGIVVWLAAIVLLVVGLSADIVTAAVSAGPVSTASPTVSGTP